MDRSIKPTYLKVDVVKVLDSLSMEQLEANAPHCKFRLKVFTKKRVFVFAAESDEEFEQWKVAVTSFLESRFSPEELSEKKQAHIVS